MLLGLVFGASLPNYESENGVVEEGIGGEHKFYSEAHLLYTLVGSSCFNGKESRFIDDDKDSLEVGDWFTRKYMKSLSGSKNEGVVSKYGFNSECDVCRNDKLIETRT